MHNQEALSEVRTWSVGLCRERHQRWAQLDTHSSQWSWQPAAEHTGRAAGLKRSVQLV